MKYVYIVQSDEQPDYAVCSSAKKAKMLVNNLNKELREELEEGEEIERKEKFRFTKHWIY